MKNENQTATFTLRIPRDLKAKAEAAATADHMSMNTWILLLMEREVRPAKGEGLNRANGSSLL